jgi:DNA repair protein RadA/Sms
MDRELKRVFQQGIKPGGMYLLGGEPGIGKSTIILQIIQDLIVSQPELAVMYLTGEE